MGGFTVAEYLNFVSPPREKGGKCLHSSLKFTSPRRGRCSIGESTASAFRSTLVLLFHIQLLLCCAGICNWCTKVDRTSEHNHSGTQQQECHCWSHRTTQLMQSTLPHHKLRKSGTPSSCCSKSNSLFTQKVCSFTTQHYTTLHGTRYTTLH